MLPDLRAVLLVLLSLAVVGNSYYLVCPKHLFGFVKSDDEVPAHEHSSHHGSHNHQAHTSHHGSASDGVDDQHDGDMEAQQFNCHITKDLGNHSSIDRICDQCLSAIGSLMSDANIAVDVLCGSTAAKLRPFISPPETPPKV